MGDFGDDDDDDIPVTLNAAIDEQRTMAFGVSPTQRATRLDDFEKGRLLGQGGMAAVYLAKNKLTGQQVALKVVQGEMAEDVFFMERFRREARATSQIIHPNVCRVFEYGEEGGIFMALEVLEGGTLRDMKMRFGGSMPAQVAALVLEDILMALSAAHQQGIVHRDLKPVNLMFDRHGVLKLLDFGIARSTSDATMTQAGMLIGTPAFMSPEQINNGKIDGRSDLFSAGVVLNDLMCGSSPFQSDNPATVLMSVLRTKPRSLFEQVPVIPIELDILHQKLLQKRPDDRPRTADEALELLRPYTERIRADHPRLMKRALDEPEVVRAELLRESATAEVKRGDELVARHGAGCQAAGVAYLRASLLEPEHPTAARRLTELLPQSGLKVGPVDDPRIAETEAALVDDPENAQLLKRLADLYKGHGRLMTSINYLQRYLRLREDGAASVQLAVLLNGPGSDPDTIMRMFPRKELSTAEIMAGVKTGRMQALERTGQNKKPTQTQTQATRAPIDYGRPPPPTGETAFVARPVEDRGVVEETWDWVRRFAPPVIGLSLLGLVAFGVLRLVRTEVKDAKVETQETIKRVDGIEEEGEWALASGTLRKAKDALANNDAGTAIREASQVFATNPPERFRLDAYYVRGKAYLLLNKRLDARKDLEEFMDYVRMGDPRRNEVRTLLDGLDTRGRGRDATP